MTERLLARGRGKGHVSLKAAAPPDRHLHLVQGRKQNGEETHKEEGGQEESHKAKVAPHMPTVKDILAKKSPGTIRMNADETVLNAALMMGNLGVGALLVTDVDRIGIFTERDLLRRVVAKQRDPATTILRDVMTWPVATCRPETSLLECLAIVEERNIRHLPVVDKEGVCGLITNRDIAAFLKEYG